MKKAILSTAALTIACALSLCASVSPVTTSDTLSRPTLVERIANIEQKSDKFHLLLHLNGSFDGYWTNDDFTRAAFKMNQARIEAKGSLLPWLSYQWRQRLNKSNTPEALDNLPASIDCAWIRVALSDDKNLTIGKQGAAYGGFEYDLDPIEIYQYSDMCDYMIFDFMTGVTFSWQLSPSQQLQAQVLNSRCGSMESVYGTLPEDVRESRAPLAYTLNWNGSFWRDQLRIRWSFSLLNQAEDHCNYFYALGNQLILGNFDMYLDFYLSDEELDSRGILTSLLSPEENGAVRCVRNVRYESWVAKLNCHLSPRWNIFAKGMYENAFIHKASSDVPKGKYRISWGYFGGVEYYPFGENLRFYLAYLGRSYRFTPKSRELAPARDYSATRLSLGFIYHIPLF